MLLQVKPALDVPERGKVALLGPHCVRKDGHTEPLLYSWTGLSY